MIGRTLSHYKILDEISRGGMGIVYRAKDVKLNREVALKVLPPELVADSERKGRLVREAQSAAALKHPNIAVVYEIDEDDGVTFIAMELVEGEALGDLLASGPLPLESFLIIATDVAQGLAEAHEHGIIHRDLKPSNILVEKDGHAKLIDFGLAKSIEELPGDSSEADTALKSETRTGQVLGTVYYMSPEQARGESIDARSDLFSFGATLYQMACGSRPFEGDTPASVFDAILNRAPAPPRASNPELPVGIERIINRLLEKDRERRYASASEVVRALTAQSVGSSASWKRTLVPAAAILLVAGALGVFLVLSNSKVRWARETAVPEILDRIERQQFAAAFELAVEAERFIGGDPLLESLWPKFSRTVAVETEPPGATVSYRAYGTQNPWTELGSSPLTARIPRSFLRWKLEKDGFETVEAAAFRGRRDEVTLHRVLHERGEFPGMVRVEGGRGSLYFPGLEHIEIELPDFLIDAFEVTNREFKEFVDSGGYENADYWEHARIDATRGDTESSFLDGTGRPGPATWDLGDYPEPQAEHPVSGVSWYEAVAYCSFRGKSLPSVFHWTRAAQTFLSNYIVPRSNFEGQGPASVGEYDGIGGYGTYDMAGNVKEWTWNEVEGKRYILGGAWDEPTYMFNDPDAQLPLDRRPSYGFRCMKLLGEEAVPAAAMEPLAMPHRDFASMEPIHDDVFALYQRLFAYDDMPLNPVVEDVDDSAEDWTAEKISLDAGYGGERFSVYLYIPKNVAPPYQTIVHFPGSGVIYNRSARGLAFDGSSGEGLGGIDRDPFLVKAGRAVVYPIYRGTYDRSGDLRNDYPEATSIYRDHVVMWAKDLGRTLDYLQSRSEFGNEFGYYGYSWGASNGSLLPAIEERLKVSVLVAGGYYLQETFPEVDHPTYAPRVTIPTLMLNGRYDFFYPVEKSQKPMFEMLGTPPEHKRHVVYDTGHTVPRNEGIKEILNWLDRYMGPVERSR